PPFDPLEDIFAKARATPPAPRLDFLNTMRRMAVEHTPQVRTVSVWHTLGGWRMGLGMAIAVGCGAMAGAYPPDIISEFIYAGGSVSDEIFTQAGYLDYSLSHFEGGDD
ncbi:MAG: hypothetical protein AAF701_03060, partial [Pseudomonadota bacterium]